VPQFTTARSGVVQFTAAAASSVQDSFIMKILAGLLVVFQSRFATAELKKRAAELESCGSTDHRLALADECSGHRMYGEAIRLYESCLHAAYANDSTILFRLARATVDSGEWDKAAETIDRLKREAPKTRPLEVRLLEARVLEGRGRIDDAIAVYQKLVPAFVGLEARYRYGELLLKVGKRQAAMEAFDDVLRAAKRFASPIEEEERWAIAAKQAVRAGA
jgi:hypothetical protein